MSRGGGQGLLALRARLYGRRGPPAPARPGGTGRLSIRGIRGQLSRCPARRAA